jgi:hypothetical protein
MKFLRRDVLAGGAAIAGLAVGSKAVGAAEALKTMSGKLKYTNYEPFAPWVAFFGGKASGVITAMDLGTGTAMANASVRWMGDPYGIPHHVAALPTQFTHGHSDARKGFVGFVSTQISANIYKVEYLGPFSTDKLKSVPKWGSPEFKFPARNFAITNVTRKTGVGAGVHVTVSPDAKWMVVVDGQKDIVAIFDSVTLDVVKVLRFEYDQTAKTVSMEFVRPLASGMYELDGKKGNKIDKEISMGEEDQAPNDMPVCDAMVFDPRGKWGAVSFRRLGAIAVIDTETWKMVAVVSTPEGQKNTTQVKKNVFKFSDIKSTMHQEGFTPDGNFLMGCNNVIQNNVGVIDSSDHGDPTKWKTVTFVKGWGRFLPFHMGFRPPDGAKLYMTSWSHQKHGKDSAIGVIDTKKWEIQGFIPVGPDMHTPQCTYDGKWVTAVHGGWQGMSYSSFVIADAETDKLVARMPMQMHPHGHVIIPHTLEDLKFSHMTTV